MNAVTAAVQHFEKEQGTAMELAKAVERTRCVRIVASWASFARRHNATPETLAILAKLAAEINGDPTYTPEDHGIAFAVAQ